MEEPKSRRMEYIEPLMAKILREFEERIISILYNRVVELGLCKKGEELSFLERNKVKIREIEDSSIYAIEANNLTYILTRIHKSAIPDIKWI